MTRGRTYRMGAVGVLVALVAGAALFWPGAGTRTVEAHFRSVTGLHEGDEVRVIGVKLGRVASITPTRRGMRVTLEVPEDLVLPADVKAAIVPPNLVSGRYVELAPAYVSGPRWDPNKALGFDRTGVPVEWDEVKEQLTDLSRALGPQGANDQGVLADAVVTADANLHGIASELRTTISSLATTTGALSAGGEDLFATIRHLSELVAMLRSSDGDVRRFADRLAEVSEVLDDNRSALTESVELLDTALVDITGFVRQNKTQLDGGLAELESLASTLARSTDNLAILLHVLPTAFGNFYNVMDPRYASVTGALAADNVRDFGQLICGAVISTGQPVTACKQALGPLVALLGLNDISIPGSFLPPAGGTGTASSQTSAPSLDRAITPRGEPLGDLSNLLGGVGR